MVNLLRSLTLAVMCLAFAPMAQALDLDKPAWEGGRLAHLARYIGTYNHGAVLNDPHVNAELQRLTGVYYERFMRIDGLTPIEYHTNDALVLYGTHNYKADKEGKFVVIGLHSGKISASLSTTEWTKAFSEEMPFDDLPGVIQDAARSAVSSDQKNSPQGGSNFEWIRVPTLKASPPQRR